MTIYKFYAVARCPVQEQLDVYEAVAESEGVIKCEDIARAVLKLSTAAVFQEDLTDALARGLGCRVRTTGVHSGVEVIAESEP